MPNWCYTNMCISGSKETIDRIYTPLLLAYKANYHKGDNTKFQDGWLGNLVKFFGEDINVNDVDFCCRGYIEQLERITDCDIALDTDSA